MRMSRFTPAALGLSLLALCVGCATTDPIVADGGGDSTSSGPGAGGLDAAGGAGGSGAGGAPGDGGAGATSSAGGSGGSTTSAMSGCGDGIVDATEECDDGNVAPSDGCDAACVVECAAPATKNPANDHCYRVFTAAMDWDAARMACGTWGGAPGLGHLASIGDAAEQAFVAPLVAQATWIGGGDAVTEGVYTWTDGTPWSYELWAPNEPNDTTVEDCVFMRSDGTWDDHDCDFAWPAYLCERRAAGTF